MLAAVTGEDETNLVAATIARFEFDVPRVIARVNNPKNAWLFNAGMGVDVAINQADLMAHLVVEEMDQTAMLTLMKISRGSHSIVQYKLSDSAGCGGSVDPHACSSGAGGVHCRVPGREDGNSAWRYGLCRR